MRALTSLVATLLLVAALPAGCGTDGPGTSVQVALQYEDALQLETADVTLLDRTQTANIAHQLLLLVPDQRAGMDMTMLVWARKAGKRAAYGTRTVVPVLGETVETSLMLTACTPGCQGNMLTSCTAPVRACTLACSEDGDAHCVEPRWSNGVEFASLDGLSATTTITTTTSGITTFDVDTGAITGGLTRAMGTGIIGGIGYVQAPAFGSGGSPLGIFVFRNLTIPGALVRFTGTRAVVWLVGDTALIGGTIDVAADRINRSPPGPGGGAGGTAASAAQGCGAGRAGVRGDTIDDSGGGGAGGSTPGAAGGQTPTAAGGAAGVACLPSNLEPLQGGSGGGRGSTGGAAMPGDGGGGGGALQITAQGRLEITGTITAGGAGGRGAPGRQADAASGGGGGGGGAILLESLTVAVSSTALLGANGGGGGGGAGSSSSFDGSNGLSAVDAAFGGQGPSVSNDGGDGGAQGSPPMRGGSGSSLLPENGGGGGGAVGAIVIRGRTVTVAGINTPTAIQLDLQTRNVP